MKKLFALFFVVFALAACNSNGGEAADGNGSESVSIISIGPAITEVVVDLGFGSNIIGTDIHSPGIPNLPDGLPLFDMMTLDAEAIVALGPDMLFISNIVPNLDNHIQILEGAGITVFALSTSATVAGINEFILTIGGHLDARAAAQNLISEMEAQIAEISAIAAGIDVQNRRTVYFEIDPPPFMFSVGAGTFLNELIGIVGGINIFADEEGWIMVADEAVLAANPVVILTNVGWMDDPVGDISSRAGWYGLDAVAAGNIHVIDTDATSRANHNITRGLWQMARAIYPEYFN